MSIPASIQASAGRLPAGALLSQAPAGVAQAIWQASQETGVDFAYLMEKAAVESDFRTDLKATTSSATGLYQFIEGTWLGAMKSYGAKYGFGQFADAITKRSDGGFSVPDPDMRKRILELRKDPKLSAELVAELTRENKTHLEQRVGGTIGSTELYMAHFLGAGGATKFLNALRQNPNQAARDIVPEAAGSNTSVFYDKQSGQPKTLAQVYERFARKFSEGSGEVVGSRMQPLEQVITNVSAGRNPMAALNNTPLSGYTMLALAALQTSDEDSDDGDTAFGSRRVGAQRPVHQAAATSGLELGRTRKAS